MTTYNTDVLTIIIDVNIERGKEKEKLKKF